MAAVAATDGEEGVVDAAARHLSGDDPERMVQLGNMYLALGQLDRAETFADHHRAGLFSGGPCHVEAFRILQPPAGRGMGAAYASGAAYCTYRSLPVMCGPRGLRGAPDHLFRNNRDGTFTDISTSRDKKYAGQARAPMNR